jgi:protein-L-isoaspartate(D-aspartate) O-methyltransferase
MGSPSRAVQAMAAIPRHDFLPADQRAHGRRDAPLPIGHGQTNSQPTTVRHMLELLDVQAGDRILDLGSGSGWTTALLAWLTGPTGWVVGVERVAQLVTFGAENLARARMPWAQIRNAVPGRLGLQAAAPFDRILVSAQAASLPAELVTQLTPEGVLVIPVAGRLLRVQPGAPHPRVEEYGRYRFVPLVTDPPQQQACDRT